MIRVVILGSGNVASHLSRAFLQAGVIDIIQVYGRSDASLKTIDDQIDKTTELNKLATADVYIIAISDDAVAALSSRLPLTNALVVHTSGSVSMDALSTTNRKGVFYPLQTFSKDADVDFKDVPVCIEAEENEDLILLEKLASAISDSVYFIDSTQRKSLHLAAVVVNNFVNHLYHIGYEICQEHQVPFEILAPLIRETAKKIETIAPIKAQTGPAKRNDEKTIDAQLAMLSEKHKKIYRQITESIKDTYGKKL
ncbi:MAG: DUF2520 domain-containing protein [Flavobacteriaceae bacterium]|nr:DUF2520 domain-containing protein [Flavobacteriaceae bacterium]